MPEYHAVIRKVPGTIQACTLLKHGRLSNTGAACKGVRRGISREGGEREIEIHICICIYTYIYIYVCGVLRVED